MGLENRMWATWIPRFALNHSGATSADIIHPEILVVTPDDRLYSSLLYVSTQYGWKTRWAKSLDRAAIILKSGTNSIVLYDWYSASQSWRQATDCLLGADSACCIVLAARHIDENLWEQALRHRLYDVVPRNCQAHVLAAMLQFAWQFKCRRGFPALDRTVLAES